MEMPDDIVINSSNMPFFKDIVRYIKHELSKEEIAILDQQLLSNEKAWELFQHLYELKQTGKLDGFLIRQQALLSSPKKEKDCGST